MIICLILLLPAASSDPPENNPGQIIVLHSVLLRVRFTWHSLLPENRWALTPPFHPYWHKPAVYLCCTIFGVTSTGRYPAPCPVKPGLSSPAALRYRGSGHLSYSQRVLVYHRIMGLSRETMLLFPTPFPANHAAFPCIPTADSLCIS